MEKTGRAIIEVKENDITKIVSIKRTKYKGNKITKEYYTLPGGHVENDETFEETVIREIYEELGIKVKIKEELMHIYSVDINKDEKFYICDYVEGEIGTGNGPEFTNIDLEKYGKYEILKIDTKKLEQYNLLPKEVKEIIIKRYNK